MSETPMTTLEPALLGFWTKCIREASHWSQEAVAASAGLDVRTIQRVEAGKPVSITTRRALARGLGYENHDVFQDLKFIASVHGLLTDLQNGKRADFQAQFPDHIHVPVTRVTSGEALGDDASFSDKLAYNREMDAMLQRLERLGASAYSATRSTRMTGEFWSDKTSMPLTIGYLAIIPADRNITEILVPRRLS
jgi:transcriptional regulator with XRE-family HTH domain